MQAVGTATVEARGRGLSGVLGVAHACWIAAFVLLAAFGAAGAAQDLGLHMEVDTTQVHVGDPVEVRLLVDHPEDWAVQWADSLDVAPFEVLRYEVAAPDPWPDGKGVASTAVLALTSFELGELEIPSIPIQVAGPDGAVRTLFTDPYRIGVVSVGLDESGDIREIRGPLAIARSWWLLLPWLLLAGAVAAGGLYLQRRMQAAPAAGPVRPKTPPRPPHLVALEALAELERSSMLERGEVKGWHVRISEIVRAYVERQLEVPALEMTTREVVAGLRAAALGAEITDGFGTFLARCDLVKFARLRPGADRSRELLGAARELVEMTSGVARKGLCSASEQSPQAGEAAAAEPAPDAPELCSAAEQSRVADEAGQPSGAGQEAPAP